MKTLITGASGFIGQSLLRQDLVGDIHTTSRIQRPLPHGIKNYCGDLKDLEFVKSLARERFDRIINLSWEGLPDLSEEINFRNLSASRVFLEAMADSGTTDFLIAGSCLEYGDLLGEVDENAIGNNLNNFAETKLLLLEFVRNLGVNYKWLRIFYAYGPHQHKNSLLASAFLSAKSGIPMAIRNPNIARDFIYVEDVASAIVKLALSPNKNGTYNIGSGKATGVAQLVNILNRQIGVENQFNESELEPTLIADVNKIKNDTNWTSRYSIDQGVGEYIKWRNSELLA